MSCTTETTVIQRTIPKQRERRPVPTQPPTPPTRKVLSKTSEYCYDPYEVWRHKRGPREQILHALFDIWVCACVTLFIAFPFTLFPYLLIGFLIWTCLCASFTVKVTVASLVAASLSIPSVYTFRARQLLGGAYVRVNRFTPFKLFFASDKPFPEDKAYVFAMYPHGRLFYSFGMLIGCFHLFMKNRCKGELRAGVTSSFFCIPFFRQFLEVLGLVPATQKTLRKLLQQNYNVGLLPGGVKEVLKGTCDDHDEIYIRRRAGFVKLAMETGAGLVPVYSFGENQLFKHEPSSVMEFLRSIDNKFCAVGAAIIPPRGPFNAPVPFRNQIVIAVGDPLFAQEGETVEHFHQRYMDALESLFYSHVGKTSRPNHKLVMA